MLSVIIPNTDEPTVVQLTYDNLRKELFSVDGSELIVADNWLAGLEKAQGDYISLVEPDCLVSGGYFSSNLGLFRKNAFYRKLAMVSSCVGVDNWGNRIYNYKLDKVVAGDEKLSVGYWHIAAERRKKGSGLYPIQIGFVPGAIFRKSALQKLVKQVDLQNRDLVALSTEISFNLWNSNRRIAINPNTTYVSTDRNIENPADFKFKVPDRAANIFTQEQI